MRRREFIGGSGVRRRGRSSRAEQPERMRRIGVLLPAAADDAEFQARVGLFLRALALLGWTIGRNVRIDTRWATANAPEIRRHAAELAALAILVGVLVEHDSKHEEKTLGYCRNGSAKSCAAVPTCLMGRKVFRKVAN